MRTDQGWAAWMTIICLLLSVTGTVKARATTPKPKLFVHAGAGIRPPLDEIGARYEKKTGTKVEYSYKGSGCLIVDIAMAKKGDVYIPGEDYYMGQARKKKLVGTSEMVAGMTTVIITQKGNPKQIGRVEDLARPGLRIGLGDFESVAAGRAAKQVLERAGVLEQVVKNRVMSALNVVELGNAVKLNHLDAAIVWDATAVLYSKNEITTIPIPENLTVHSPIPAAVVKFSAQPKEAARFIEFLRSEEAASIFLKHGYSVPQRPARRESKSGGDGRGRSGHR